MLKTEVLFSWSEVGSSKSGAFVTPLNHSRVGLPISCAVSTCKPLLLRKGLPGTWGPPRAHMWCLRGEEATDKTALYRSRRTSQGACKKTSPGGRPYAGAPKSSLQLTILVTHFEIMCVCMCACICWWFSSLRFYPHPFLPLSKA